MACKGGHQERKRGRGERRERKGGTAGEEDRGNKEKKTFFWRDRRRISQI